jgi:hypothetical protein
MMVNLEQLQSSFEEQTFLVKDQRDSFNERISRKNSELSSKAAKPRIIYFYLFFSSLTYY